MIIKFSPQRSDAVLTSLSVAGDVLTINGEDFDFGALGEGDVLPIGAVASPFVMGTVTRTGGAVMASILLPLPADASLARRFPVVVDIASGQVEIPQ